MGLLGSSDEIVCQGSVSTSPATLNCSVSSEQADQLWDSGAYVSLTNGVDDLRGQIVHQSGAGDISGTVSFF